MLLQHGGQTPAAAGNPMGEARVAFQGLTQGLIPILGQEQGGCRREGPEPQLQPQEVTRGSSPGRSGWLGRSLATPLPIPAAPSKSRRAPAWPGSMGVSPWVSAAPCVFPSMAGLVPGTHCQRQQHTAPGIHGGWGDTGGF